MRDIKTYDAYLFDWDGTLASSHDFILKYVKQQLSAYNMSLTDQQIVEKLFGRYQAGMTELGFSAEDIARLGGELHLHMKENMPLAALYPQARTMLEMLHAKEGKIALITASYREVIDAAITAHDLVALFDCIVTGDEVGAQKPEPEGLLKALATLGVKPENAVMIGDSKKDVMAGRNAGTDTLLFYPPEHESQHDLTELKRHKPTYVVGSWQECIDRLQ
jgi:pyrophosphatase PpaX